MKGVSILQPWASLIAHGQLAYIPRSWATPYRGPLAIHASKDWSRRQQAESLSPPVREALSWILTRENRSQDAIEGTLPLGALVGTAWLRDCVPTDQGWRSALEEALQDALGGRWAWRLADAAPIRWPIPFRGGARLWDIEGRR